MSLDAAITLPYCAGQNFEKLKCSNELGSVQPAQQHRSSADNVRPSHLGWRSTCYGTKEQLLKEYDRIDRALIKVAQLASDDLTYMPIFERLEKELAQMAKAINDNPLDRAREIAQKIASR